ncbi:MAG TPA: FAD binding domain-containing protein, partial [Hyphomicrobiaceae bacterium]|nr:FAD binding domain-containing protein [Hyphomicrobiaceae bacterium]
MKAGSFRYERAYTLAEVFRLRREAGGDAQLLAGGQSLLAALAFRLSEPSLIIDISRVRDLKGVSVLPSGHLRVGALTTHRELAAHPDVNRHAPLLAEAVPLIAHAAIRNRGTIGGSLAFADAAAELPACCVALEARIIATGPNGERAIPAATFFTGLFATALAEDELIQAVEFPCAAPGDRATIVELTRRCGDYAMAGLAAWAQHVDARLQTPRLVYFGVGAGPVVAGAAARALGPGPWTPHKVAEAQTLLDRDLDPPPDQHGGPEMKRHLARVLLARAVGKLGVEPGVRAA